MAELGAWLRRLRGWPRRGRTDHTRAITPPQTKPSQLRWVLVESVGSAPLGAMYADLLQQAGIPVRIEQWDAGSGAFGGLPRGMRLLVPQECLKAAQEVLNVVEVGEGESR